ncbi:hypothetical protein MAQ5080_03347 [Marinomonas aquimarina]|uniref:SpoVT / AbrB like domain protein n=1 Tax=Marinomonas aquimarina TaxID=295068 RepID=A0A1A8TPC1_9GAMM|nr:hypothetical protein [Marinomonas aquimarina]SBS36064.1 hypothetical protein MAQ5080_03347 [Marinomonas aquimarina]
MRTSIRKINNEHLVIIPDHIIKSLQIEDDVEINIKHGSLVLTPKKKLRQGWFDSYNIKKDDEALNTLRYTHSELQDWDW